MLIHGGVLHLVLLKAYRSRDHTMVYLTIHRRSLIMYLADILYVIIRFFFDIFLFFIKMSVHYLITLATRRMSYNNSDIPSRETVGLRKNSGMMRSSSSGSFAFLSWSPPMHQIPPRMIFFAVVGLTLLCGIGAVFTALQPDVTAGGNPKIDALHSTLTHIFSGGVGAIISMLARG